MALKTLVKVGNINNLSDARYCAGMGVDLIGFRSDSNDSEAISLELYAAITEWLEGVKFVGEFYNSNKETIEHNLDKFEFEYLEINTAEHIGFFSELPIGIIFQIDFNDTSIEEAQQLFSEYHTKVSYFLLENSSTTILSEGEKALLKSLAAKHPIILGYGFEKDNVTTVLNEISPVGLALKGGKEIRPGYREFDDLADILEALEIED